MSISQDAGAIQRALWLLVLERIESGATREVDNAYANPVWGAQAAASASPAIGVLVRRAVNLASAPTAVIQPLGSVWPG